MPSLIKPSSTGSRRLIVIRFKRVRPSDFKSLNVRVIRRCRDHHRVFRLQCFPEKFHRLRFRACAEKSVMRFIHHHADAKLSLAQSRRRVLRSVRFCSPGRWTLRLSFTFVATVCHVVTKTSPVRLSAACRSSDNSRSRRPGNSARNAEAVWPVTPLNGANQNQTTDSVAENCSTICPAIRVLPAPVGASKSSLPCCEIAAARLAASSRATSSSRLHSAKICSPLSTAVSWNGLGVVRLISILPVAAEVTRLKLFPVIKVTEFEMSLLTSAAAGY